MIATAFAILVDVPLPPTILTDAVVYPVPAVNILIPETAPLAIYA